MRDGFSHELIVVKKKVFFHIGEKIKLKENTECRSFWILNISLPFLEPR